MHDLGTLRSSKKESNSPEYCRKILDRVILAKHTKTRNYLRQSNIAEIKPFFTAENKNQNFSHIKMNVNYVTPNKKQV